MSFHFDSHDALREFRNQDSPVLVVALDDRRERATCYQRNIYDVATGAAGDLIGSRRLAERLGCFPGDEFHPAADWPVLAGGHPRYVRDFELFFGSFFGAHRPDVVVLIGTEPSQRFRLFVEQVYAFLSWYGISRVVELTARLSFNQRQRSPVIHQPGLPGFSSVANDPFAPHHPGPLPAEGPASGIAPLLHMASSRGSDVELDCLEVEIPADYSHQNARQLSLLLVEQLRRLIWDEPDDEPDFIYRSGAT